MGKNIFQKNKRNHAVSMANREGVLDTSLMVKKLEYNYSKNKEPISVDFREMVSWVKGGDQLNHLIHPYPAKLLPNIANFFCRAKVLTGKGRILDPFCGSGTVALEASLVGASPYVADANPLALLITKVKTYPYNISSLVDVMESVIAKARRYKVAPEVRIVNESLWYSEKRKKELEIILRAINEVEDQHEKDFFRVAFSQLAKRFSFCDLSVSVPVRLKVKESYSESLKKKTKKRIEWVNNASVEAEFIRICMQNITRTNAANSLNPNRSSAVVVANDARKIAESNEKFSLILTSPPYGSAQKYVRSSSLSLNWLGFAKPDELSEMESRSIGREHLPKKFGAEAEGRLPDEFERALLKAKKTNQRRYLINKQYLLDMQDAIASMHAALEPGGNLVIVIGNNSVCGEPLRNDKFVCEVAQSLGMKQKLILDDPIKSRGLMTRRNKTASVIKSEKIIVLSR
ncbi:hypothetical protein [Alloalcanivorax xenomutans]|uniref:hypothetical protein n=1 Tax=Alloalcanivorax xenomutans TaxID=1094342 RepID=UPI003C66164D